MRTTKSSADRGYSGIDCDGDGTYRGCYSSVVMVATQQLRSNGLVEVVAVWWICRVLWLVRCVICGDHSGGGVGLGIFLVGLVVEVWWREDREDGSCGGSCDGDGDGGGCCCGCGLVVIAVAVLVVVMEVTTMVVDLWIFLVGGGSGVVQWKWWFTVVESVDGGGVDGDGFEATTMVVGTGDRCGGYFEVLVVIVIAVVLSMVLLEAVVRWWWSQIVLLIVINKLVGV